MADMHTQFKIVVTNTNIHLTCGSEFWAKIPLRLNGAFYKDFLQEQVPILVKNVPLAIRLRMCFMHYGATAHSNKTAHQYLEDVYPNHWIGRAGHQPWLPISTDLNPLDF